MLQAHSLLWHYFWVAPNVLLLILAGEMWRRNLAREFPAFFAFAVLSSAGQFSVYGADLSDSIGPFTFWRIDWVSLLVESLLKFAVIGEVFSRMLKPFPAVSRLGKLLIRGTGAALVLAAALAAALGHSDSTYLLISGAHTLEQTAFLIATGLALFLFSFANYFHLRWDRASYGIMLGLAISGCEHLATWAAMTNGNLSVHARTLLDFLNMATYHVCVLIWMYYLLTSEKSSPQPPQPPPDHTLDDWNRELERLLHK